MAEVPRLSWFNSVVAVWFSCSQRMLLRFISGTLDKGMSKVVFEPSSADKSLGRKLLCDLFSFSARFIIQAVGALRAKRLMCFTSCEGIPLCLCTLMGLFVIYHVEWRGFESISTNQLSSVKKSLWLGHKGTVGICN